MSRQNKVNPGMYTQRGRLAQDDAARELVRQRSAGVPISWQHGQQAKLPHFKGSEPAVHKDEPVKQKAAAKKTTAKVATKPAAPAARKTARKSAATTAGKKVAKPVARKAAKRAPSKKGKAPVRKRTRSTARG